MHDNSIKLRIQAINEINDVLCGKTYKENYFKNKLIKSLVSTSLRRLGEIQFYINSYMKKPLKKEHNLIKANLIIGITQILYMNIPDYASVNTSVEIAKINSPHHIKLVNAVLRNIIRDIKSKKFKQANASINIPNKIKKRWGNHFNKKEIEEIMQQNIIVPPALDIAISRKEDIDQWKKNLKGEIFGKNNIRITNSSGKIENLYGYNKGKWWIQDYSAQIPAKILISSIKDNPKIIDMCAAPGGKTAQMINYGANVTSIEINTKRAQILKENLKRLNLKSKIIIDNAINFKSKLPVDGILLDAPCSSTGTFRKNPDIPWRIENDNNFNKKLSNLCKTQKMLLESASKSLKIGGTLIYCVCSLEIEEGKNQIIDFVKNNRNFSIKPILKNEINIINKAITKEGFIRTLPHYYKSKGGIDGFFIARLIKKN